MAGTDEKVDAVNDSEAPVLVSVSSNCESSEDLKDLSSFRTERIVNCDSRHKIIVALGSFAESSERALVVLEKKPFDSEGFDKLCTEDTVFKKVFQNDIYGNYDCLPVSDLNAVKATVIVPASEKHILKYESQIIHIIQESAELYLSVTLPYLEKEQLNLQWVYNILNREAEQERIVTEDLDHSVGFVLLPDLKWDGHDLKSLYLLALVRQTGIKSLRDLTAEHIPLLENILSKCNNVIKEKYGLPPSRIRAFLHYQPSFYHLHIHFTYLQYDAPGIHTERAHLLSTVIDNIKLVPDYYQKASLPFTVRQADRLFSVLNEKGIID